MLACAPVPIPPPWPAGPLTGSRSGPSHLPPPGLAGSALAECFRLWHGGSGRRYVFSVMAIGASQPLGDLLFRYADAVVLAVRRTRAQEIEVVWIGQTGVPELTFDHATILGMQRQGVTEIHTHLLAGSDDDRRRVVNDIRATLSGSSPGPR